MTKKKSKQSSSSASSSQQQKSSSSSSSTTNNLSEDVFDGAIGIDFGNHNCTVAYFNMQHLLSGFPNLNTTSALSSTSKKPSYVSTVIQPVQNLNTHVVIIQNEDGAHHTPSVIKVNTIVEGEGDNETTREEIIVGFPPLPGASIPADQVVYDLKEFILESEEKIKKGEEEELISFNGAEYTQDHMVSILLGKMKNIAEHYLGKTVKKVVVSCPSNSPHSEKVIKKACETLGMNVLAVLKEPLAALIGYGFDLPPATVEEKKEKIVCVVDVGALETNISVVRVNENGMLQMIKSESKRPLGGESLDQVLIQMCLQEFKRLYFRSMNERMFQDEVGKNRKVLSKLRFSCENAKNVLSMNQQAMVDVDSLYDGMDFSFKLTRARYESSAMSIFASIIEHAKQTVESLADQGISLSSIEHVVLVGGSCQIPKLKDSIQTLFSQAKIYDNAVEDSIAIGCAIQANLINTYQHLMNKDE
ncbi:predicted protein [Naegleria gruberi]|uniref:Predicted protein n=1 Tax=Naegleria gruberi TaxID=5762 RepID=D2W0S1_NAEGR|nr:uncharacterized protein NAEGRDRAFT_53792 [Naegleria gruberi]EFC37340.1 predicted protein [Naegleria gruberi]|eukprot:XP_002670084.1 predicted protein [Naegleria gruberi strain NEG-M]